MTEKEEIIKPVSQGLQTKDQLHQRMNWLSGILESAKDMVAALDTNFCFVAFNSAYKKEFNSLFGTEIYIGMPLEDAISHLPSKLKGARANWGMVLQGKEFSRQWNLVNKDLEEKHYEVNYSCIRNEKGEIIGATTFIRDITEKVKAQEEVKNTREFVLLANTMPEIIWTSWKNGRNDFFNKRATEYSGIPQESLLKKGWQQLIHPDDLQASLFMLHEFRQKGEPIELEYRLLRKDGTYRWFMVRLVPLKIINGEFVKYLGSATDIHEKRMLLEKLAQKAKELQQISEAIPQLVWTSNSEGQHSFFNRRWMEYTGLHLDSASDNELWTTALHPEDLEQTLFKWNHSLSTGASYHTEYRLRGKDRAYRWFLSVAVPLRNKGGKIIQWFGTLTDIHDQKLQRDELDQKNQRLFQINHYLDEFVHVVAHDLRSPVAGLKLSFELLNQVEEEKKEKILKGCNSYLDRLDNTLKGLVQLIEIQEDTDCLQCEEVDVRSLSEEIAVDLQEKIQKAGATFSYGTFEWESIFYPKPYLFNILQNITRYALHFRDPGRELRFHISTSLHEEGFLLIRLEENGPGLNLDKEMKNLFKPFSHINKGSDRQGMGMSIVKHIVEKNGGKILVESTMGKGTTFEIYLKEYKKENE